MDRRIPLRSRAPLYQPDTSQYIISTQPSVGGKRVRRKKPVKDRGVKRSRYYTRAAKSGKIVFDTKEARAARNLYAGRRQTYAQQAAANEVGRQGLGEQRQQQPPIIINQGGADVVNERLTNLVAQGFRYQADRNRIADRPQPQRLPAEDVWRPFHNWQDRLEDRLSRSAPSSRSVGEEPQPQPQPQPQAEAEPEEADILVEPAQEPAPERAPRRRRPKQEVEPLVQEVEAEYEPVERGGRTLRGTPARFGVFTAGGGGGYAESDQGSGDSDFVEEVESRAKGRLNRSGAKKTRQLAEQDALRERARLEQQGLRAQRELDRQLAEEEEGLKRAGRALALIEASDPSEDTSISTGSPSESEGSVYREAVEEGQQWLAEEKRKKRRGVFLREAVQKGKGILASAFPRKKEPEGAIFFDNPFEEDIIDRGRGIDRVSPLQAVGGLEGVDITYNPAASLSGISFETDSQDIAFD